MGLLDRLFGKKEKVSPERQEALAKVRALSMQPFMGEQDVEKLRACFPNPKDFDLKLDAVNNLFEHDRNDWAEALALDIAHDEDVPLTLLKGLVKHFVESDRVAVVLEPLEWLVDERPSETEYALKLCRYLLRQNDYERCLENITAPLHSAPESRHLFAVAGECHFRLKHWEDAVIHLRTACELYENAFKLHHILPDDMTNEQFEFTRLYGMLEDAARQHYGADNMQEAFENITMEPSSFGLAKEAENLAAARVEYKPPSNVLLSIGDLEKACAEMAGNPDQEPCRRYYEGQRALREGDYAKAMQLFRESLELDLEAYGSYFGWAACENLQRIEAVPTDGPVLPAAQLEDLEKVVADWPALTGGERKIVLAACAPIAAHLRAMAEQNARVTIHPLDVRLRDLYPQRTEMRFDSEGKSPQAAAAFASKFKAHIRLDEFLHVRPEHFTFARMLGYLLSDTLQARGGKQLDEAKTLMNKVKGMLGSGGLVVTNLDLFLATAVELLACVRLFGDTARNEYAENFEKAGVFAFLEG